MLLEERSQSIPTLSKVWMNPMSLLVTSPTDWSFVDKFNDLQEIMLIVFINNAQYIGGPIEKMSDHEIKHTVDTNVTSQILLMKNYHVGSRGWEVD